jgi:hypothetical protein
MLDDIGGADPGIGGNEGILLVVGGSTGELVGSLPSDIGEVLGV